MTADERINAMTERAEIERLLQMTGRSLEGLPETYSSEERERHWHALVGDMKFGDVLLHQSDVIELLVGALRDALDERDYAVLRLCEHDGCEGCKHEECPHEDEPCASCFRMWQYEEDDNWEFGVIGKKVETEWES